MNSTLSGSKVCALSPNKELSPTEEVYVEHCPRSHLYFPHQPQGAVTGEETLRVYLCCPLIFALPLSLLCNVVRAKIKGSTWTPGWTPPPETIQHVMRFVISLCKVTFSNWTWMGVGNLYRRITPTLGIPSPAFSTLYGWDTHPSHAICQVPFILPPWWNQLEVINSTAVSLGWESCLAVLRRNINSPLSLPLYVLLWLNMSPQFHVWGMSTRFFWWAFWGVVWVIKALPSFMAMCYCRMADRRQLCHTTWCLLPWCDEAWRLRQIWLDACSILQDFSGSYRWREGHSGD